jgi:hypothetical protein
MLRLLKMGLRLLVKVDGPNFHLFFSAFNLPTYPSCFPQPMYVTIFSCRNCCGIHVAFNNQFHGLTAAHKFAVAAMKDFNNIAANLTFINLKFLSHPPLLLE